ncbi:MAG: helix-turn-helix domain-containing protein [Cyanobium sp.]
MAASRLSDAQKEAMVAAYRQGATAAALASTFGCSPNTVSRVVKVALSSDELADLKQRRTRAEAVVAAPDPVGVGVIADLDAEMDVEGDAEPIRGDGADDDGPGVLAIDDADDFAPEDADSEVDQEADPDGDELEEFGSDDQACALAPMAGAVAGQQPVECRCLSEAKLPAAAYLLVDKTVELQPVALSECADLGPLPEEEQIRQALQVFVNPRLAKRHCGRSQRVIPLPDLSLLQRTAPYLLAQGISRVVIEGSLYSLPGS